VNFDGSKKNSKISFVDLAGPRPGAAGANKAAVTTTRDLNCLVKIVQGLATGQNPAFNDSMLTRYLKESLSGNSKTTFLCTLNKPAKYAADSMNTLLLAFYAKKLLTKPQSGKVQSASEMKALIEKQ
jgi:hypothetical protein